MPHSLFLTALDGWSAPRKAAWDAMNGGGRAEVEQYYFHYLPPNEKPGLAGEWNARETTSFERLLDEHPEKLKDELWGLLSMHVPGRTGAQCKTAPKPGWWTSRGSRYA